MARDSPKRGKRPRKSSDPPRGTEAADQSGPGPSKTKKSKPQPKAGQKSGCLPGESRHTSWSNYKIPNPANVLGEWTDIPNWGHRNDSPLLKKLPVEIMDKMFGIQSGLKVSKVVRG
jgi:hypothetical protein